MKENKKPKMLSDQIKDFEALKEKLKNSRTFQQRLDIIADAMTSLASLIPQLQLQTSFFYKQALLCVSDMERCGKHQKFLEESIWNGMEHH
jgi:hypothetical protein